MLNISSTFCWYMRYTLLKRSREFVLRTIFRYPPPFFLSSFMDSCILYKIFILVYQHFGSCKDHCFNFNFSLFFYMFIFWMMMMIIQFSPGFLLLHQLKCTTYFLEVSILPKVITKIGYLFIMSFCSY